MPCVVRFPAKWVDASRFEAALRSPSGPHNATSLEVTFEFPIGCKVMVDTGIRLLSLLNQLASTTRRVRLDFEEGETGTMGYLDRMGFFDYLADDDANADAFVADVLAAGEAGSKGEA